VIKTMQTFTAHSLLLLLTLAMCAATHAQTDTGINRSFTEPFEQSVAASGETGIVVEAAIKEGDRVRVGDVLAKINHTVLKAELEIAKARANSTARLEAATSGAELIKSQHDALQSLVAEGHTNKYEVQQKEAEFVTAFAEYRAAEDELQLNRLEVKRIEAQIQGRIIKSPINGFVTEIHKQLGENLSSNEPQYATVVRVDELKVRFYLDANTLQDLRVGQQVNVLVGRDQDPNRATVTYVSPIIDPDSGLGRIDIKIDNRKMALKSGVICFWSDEHLSQASSEPSASGNDKYFLQR